MTVYATRHTDDLAGRISENAPIYAFETEADARAWLLADLRTRRPTIAPGTFERNWRVTDSLFPPDIAKVVAPLGLDDIASAPTGGNLYAHRPTVTVLCIREADA